VIMPDKYLEPSQSLFYLGAIILNILENKNINIVDLWLQFKNDTKECFSYTRFLQTLVYLFTINAISYDKRGGIHIENNKH